MSDQSMLWGHAISFWDTWGVRAMIGGAILGFIALAVSLFSSFVLYRVADIAQSELQSKTAELENANLKLEAQIAPRRLNDEQARAIGASLSRFSGQAVRLKSYALDIEGAVIGQQILDALTLAGIKIDDNRMSQGALGSIALAIRVYGDNNDLVEMLLRSLSSIGHLAVLPDEPPPMAGMALGSSSSAVAATVFVGIKPIAK